MNKIVYITGCLGFIGSYVTRKCLERGWYVRGIDKITYASNPNLLYEFLEYPNFVFEEKDINDIEFLYECDYFINTAAETHVGNSIIKSEDFLHSNVQGVYGDIETGDHTEKDILKPSNPYAATKAAADQLVLAWARTYNLPYVIVRPTNNYGIGQYVEKLIPKSVKFLSLDRKIPLHNGGTPIRNWLNADDTAEAVMVIIDNKVQNEIFNICGGFEQSNLETVEKIINLMAPHENIDNYLNLHIVRVGQDIRYALDDSKLRALGWSPKKIFDQELPKIVEYYKNNFIW